MGSDEPIEIIELILVDKELRESLEIIAELAGVPIEMIIVTACSHYVKYVNEHGFPHYCGLRLSVSEETGPVLERVAPNEKRSGA